MSLFGRSGLARWVPVDRSSAYNHLVAIISINSISVLPTVLLKALVIFAVVTRKRSNLERVSTLSLIWHKFATLTHLVLITVDRYIAIKKPLRYRDIVTTRRVTVAVLSVWTFAIFVVISEVILSGVNSGADMYNIYLTIWDLVLITVTSISIISIIRMYSYIFSETRRQQRSQTEHLSAEEIATIRRNNRAAKTPRNRPWYVTCDIPANNNIHYNVLFSEPRTACFKLHRELGGNVSDVGRPVQSRCSLLAQGGIAPGIFGDSSFKKSRKQPVTRSDRDASSSTSSLT